MPYRRRYRRTRRRSRPYPRRRFRRRRIRRTRHVARPEKKMVEYSNTNQPDWSGAVVGLFANVDQGIGADERIGNRYFAKHVLMRYYVSMDLQATTTLFRIIVGYSLATSAEPAVNDILDGTGADSVVSPLRFYKTSNTGRFKILHNKLHSLNSLSRPWAQGRFIIRINEMLQMENATTDYPRNKTWWMLFISNEETDTPKIEFNSRFYFTDS